MALAREWNAKSFKTVRAKKRSYNAIDLINMHFPSFSTYLTLTVLLFTRLWGKQGASVRRILYPFRCKTEEDIFEHFILFSRTVFQNIWDKCASILNNEPSTSFSSCSHSSELSFYIVVQYINRWFFLIPLHTEKDMRVISFFRLWHPLKKPSFLLPHLTPSIFKISPACQGQWYNSIWFPIQV